MLLGGTPSVLSDVKLGLVMHLKQSIPSLWIEEEELRISHYVTEKLQSHKAIVLLGRRSTIETNKCSKFCSYIYIYIYIYITYIYYINFTMYVLYFYIRYIYIYMNRIKVSTNIFIFNSLSG